MPDFRAFCRPPEKEPRSLVLSASESHHLVAVNRARAGATVVVFDGAGSEWICELTNDSKKAAELSVRFSQTTSPLPHRISLAQALPKGGTMDAIVRKATEIGAAEIIPLQSERTQVHLDGGRSDKKQEKWSVAALEAAKQCGNPWLPEIQPLADATSYFESSRDFDLKLIASLHPGAKSLKTVLHESTENLGRAPHRVLWAIGPEGDFTPSEMNVAQSAGFQPITLGPLVLRCETAAVYALSVLSYELSA
ncbi:MAG: 16S rRNA (uracil(1498)-N(3))-methyltransferase [Synoicihabitans sp.]